MGVPRGHSLATQRFAIACPLITERRKVEDMLGYHHLAGVAGVAAAAVFGLSSLLVVSFAVSVAAAPSVAMPESPEAAAVSFGALPFLDALARESVLYQPEPLNTMPTGCTSLRMGAPHSGHVFNGSS